MDKDQNRFSIWNYDLEKLKAKAKGKEQVEKPRFIINPESKFIDYWSKTMTVLLIFTAIVTPYRISFVEYDNLPWLVVEYVITCLFFADFIINCLLAYYDKEKNLVFDHRKILSNYFLGWMIPDLFACMPFNIILEQKQYNSLVRVARIPRLYRLFKITKLLRITKVMKNSSKILKHMNIILKISIAFERIFWFVFTYFIFLHLVACLWVFVGNLEPSSQNWISIGGYQDADSVELYIISLYWTITTFATVGYGDIVATNLIEKTFTVIVMTLGIIFYSYSVSSLTNVLSTIDSRKAKLKNQLVTLDMIHKEYSLSKTFYLQLARALEFVNKRSRHGIEEFVKDLPGALGNNVLIVAYEKILSDNFFFEKKSTDFVAWVAPRLKFYRVEMNEIIYSVDDYAIQMYFITRGVVEFVLFRIQRIIPYYELEGKYYFGEIDLLFSEDKKHLHSTRAGEVSEMLTLSRENFILLLNTFEVEAIDICGKAKERLERINEKLQDTEIKIKNNDFSIEKRKTYPQQADFMYFDKIRRSIKTNESQDLDKKHSQNLFKKIIESKKRIRYHHGKDIKNKVEELEKETTALKEVLIDLQNAVSDKYPKFVKKIPIFSPDTSSNESYVSSNENDLSVN
jgi:hypothetical protein